MTKKIWKYLSAHPVYNSVVHVLIGVGIGALITYPFLMPHPVRWGLLLIGLGIGGHLYPVWAKK